MIGCPWQMMDWSWPMMVGMLLFWALLLAAVAAGVVFLVRALRKRTPAQRGEVSSAAVAVLEERYARGEIDEDEFTRHREVLLGR